MLGTKKITLEEAKIILTARGQEHVLTYWNELSAGERATLLHRIAAIDWQVLDALKKQKDAQKSQLTPPTTVTTDQIKEHWSDYRNKGLSMIRTGKVGAVLLAGGMGTRLGYDRPKGTIDIGENKELYIFECQIRRLLDVTNEAHALVPLYIMTSDKTDEVTRRFLKLHNYFGYPENQISFFRQDTNPCVDLNGKILMESKYKIASSPNGNGGWFASMYKAGLQGALKNKGIQWLNVFAVDNVLQRIADPVFLGAVAMSGCDSGSKVVKKIDPEEKVGVLCKKDGHPAVVEYYEMDAATKAKRTLSGDLKFRYGVILNYLFRIDQLEKIMTVSMPIHMASKRIPYMDKNGNLVTPKEPNGYKFETLAADMVELMSDTLAFEVVRNREFAPIKNRTGSDTIDTARTLLKENGVLL